LNPIVQDQADGLGDSSAPSAGLLVGAKCSQQASGVWETAIAVTPNGNYSAIAADHSAQIAESLLSLSGAAVGGVAAAGLRVMTWPLS
jgi:hypothetical protein